MVSIQVNVYQAEGDFCYGDIEFGLQAQEEIIPAPVRWYSWIIVLGLEPLHQLIPSLLHHFFIC